MDTDLIPDPENRDETNSKAARREAWKIGSFTLRPISSVSYGLMIDAGIAPGMRFKNGPLAAFKFIYIHTADPDEVIEVCEDSAELRRKAYALQAQIDIADLGAFIEQAQEIVARMWKEVESARHESAGVSVGKKK